MSLHDLYARTTPFELVMASDEEAYALVAAVEEEAEGRGVDPTDPGGFLTLGSADAFVGTMAEDESQVEALHRFGPLVYHVVRFARAGRPLYVLTTHVARYLVEGRSEGAPSSPAQAGYLQLPQHLFWTRAAGESPESIDGIFWSVGRGRLLHSLLVTGVRPDRPGMGVVPLPEAPMDDAPAWVDLDAREEGGDFSTDLPGAEIDALYEIRSAGEVFKLLARFFAYVGSVPEALEASAAVMPSDAGPTPSRLDFVRVTLGTP